MREILFRGKRVDHGQWVYGCIRIVQGRYYVIQEDSSPFGFEVDPATVGQYTGLHDKNGIMIFEGDIIALNPRRFANKRVFYYTRCSGFFLTGVMDEPKPCDINPIFSEDCDRYEVIGNVFDNAELLKGGK